MTTSTPLIEVLEISFWHRRMGIVGDGIAGQCTKIRIGHEIGYVRENCQVLGGTFLISSNERMGFSREGLTKSVDVLELATDAGWQAMANAVCELDPLRRKVVKSRRWTVATALRLFERRGL